MSMDENQLFENYVKENKGKLISMFINTGNYLIALLSALIVLDSRYNEKKHMHFIDDNMLKNMILVMFFVLLYELLYAVIYPFLQLMLPKKLPTGSDAIAIYVILVLTILLTIIIFKCTPIISFFV